MPKTTPKLKTRYVCSSCGSAQMRWAGKCPDCGEWNTLVEEVYQESKTDTHRTPLSAIEPHKLSDIRAEDIRRLPVAIGELSRVLGGGIVPGSLVLIGGEPGIGKSTLLLQAAVSVAQTSGTTLYVSGEES